MARKSRGYVNAFGVNETETTEVNSEDITKQETVTETIQQPVEETNKKTEQIIEHKVETVTSDLNDLIQMGKKKQKVEDTHTRQTWLIENDLLKEFEKHCKGKGKGYKTKFVNTAIKKLLAEISE